MDIQYLINHLIQHFMYSNVVLYGLLNLWSIGTLRGQEYHGIRTTVGIWYTTRVLRGYGWKDSALFLDGNKQRVVFIDRKTDW
jgi:hypothetical protein